MKLLILFLSLLLACGSCKNKMQDREEQPIPIDIPITGTWQVIGYVDGNCDKKQAGVFAPEKDGLVFMFYDDLRFKRVLKPSEVLECGNGDGTYSLSEKKTSDGKLRKIIRMKFDCTGGTADYGSITFVEYYNIVRAENGETHLNTFPYPECLDGSSYTVYKKL